jgi:DNA end-binding protein Ku
VVRTKEYLVAVRVREGALALSTMLFHDEIRDSDAIETGGKKPTRKALENAVAIIEELSTDWDPERYTDCYRELLKRVIYRKRKGERIRAPKPEREPAPAPDLMAALGQTLERIRGGGDARAAREAAQAGQDGRDELERLGRQELYERAQDAGIPGRSKMSKDELVEALANRD